METRPRMENGHGKEAWNVEWTWKRGLECRMVDLECGMNFETRSRM